jgi:hypothetical protein
MELMMQRRESPAVKINLAIELLRNVRLQLEAANDPAAPLDQQLQHWYHVRQHHEAVKVLANEAEALSKHLSYEQLPAAFRAAHARSITLDGLGRFALSSRTTARVHDQSAANRFLHDNRRGDAVRAMVPAMTLNSIVAELIKEGVEPSREQDGIEANTYAYTSFTKD